MKRPDKHDHLLDKAIELFSRRGFHGTSIDAIVAETGIAKTTIYRHFETKEDLIVAALRRTDEEFRLQMRTFVEAASADPTERIFASFDFLEVWFQSNSFYGCPFLSAASEYVEQTDLVFQEARLHKRLMVAYFEELARAASLADPVDVAKRINLLQEGAVASAQITGEPSEARMAKHLAAELILNNGN